MRKEKKNVPSPIVMLSLSPRHHVVPSSCHPLAISPVHVPLTMLSLPPMHQPYSLQAVAHSGGVWCHGLVVSAVVRGVRLHLLSPLSWSSEDAPCGRCWFIMLWGRWWGVISMRWQIKEGWGAYLPHMGLRLPSPPIAICSPFHPSCFFLRSSPGAWGAHSQGDSLSFFPKKSINLMVS